MTRSFRFGVQPATTLYPGTLAAADQASITNYFHVGFANLLDYGGDPTGQKDNTAAFNAAMAALPNGGTLWVPSGTYLLTGTVTITTAGIQIVGASRNGSTITTNSTTADMFLVNNWFVLFYNLTLTTSVNRTAGYAINAPAGFDYCRVAHCNITAGPSTLHYNGINMSNLLMVIDDVQFQFWSNAMVFISAASNANQFIHNILGSNAVQARYGVFIQNMGSLMISDSDIVNAGQAMYVNPTTGISIPSIECVNTFFDTSVNGLCFSANGTGNVVRCKFTNCWFGNNSNSGIMFSGSGGGIDGISFVNCDFYNNATGINVLAAPNNWSVSNSRFAGNFSAGLYLSASSVVHYPQIFNNSFAAQAGFGNNGVGIIIATGSYLGLKIANNTFTTISSSALQLGLVTAVSASQFAIHDNPGINPRGAAGVTQPAVPASAAVVTNTTGFRIQIFIRAGTISAISVNGVATGITAAPSTTGVFMATLEPGGTISVTYTIAPTWVWIAS